MNTATMADGWITFGLALLCGVVGAPLAYLLMVADEGEELCGQPVVGFCGFVASVLGAFYFFGTSIEHLHSHSQWAPWIAFGALNAVLALLGLLNPKHSLGECWLYCLIATTSIAIVAWALFWLKWLSGIDWYHIGIGSVVLLPGCLAAGLLRMRSRHPG